MGSPSYAFSALAESFMEQQTHFPEGEMQGVQSSRSINLILGSRNLGYLQVPSKKTQFFHDAPSAIHHGNHVAEQDFTC